jgi:hypothetical protein
VSSDPNDPGHPGYYRPEPFHPQPYPPPQYQQQPPQYPTYPAAGPYPPPGYGYGYVHRATNGLAIASMVLGILWVYWIGSILALIFGFIARRQIKERNESGDGMAIAGIVLGFVGLATLIVVVVIFAVGASTGSS